MKGNPDTVVTIKGWQPETVEAGLVSNPGIVATAAHCVNAVPYVCAAPPGIVTSLDLPLVAGRAHPRLLGLASASRPLWFLADFCTRVVESADPQPWCRTAQKTVEKKCHRSVGGLFLPVSSDATTEKEQQ